MSFSNDSIDILKELLLLVGLGMMVKVQTSSMGKDVKFTWRIREIQYVDRSRERHPTPLNTSPRLYLLPR